MKTRGILLLSVLLTETTKSSAVHIFWYYFPPLAFEDDNGDLSGVLADLAVEMGKLCFDGNLTYTEFNSTMAFEEGLVDGDTYVAGPISRGANTCVTWPTNQYFIPVLQSNGPSVLKSQFRTTNTMAQLIFGCWALPLIIITSAGIAGCVIWMLDHYNNQSDFPKPVFSGVWEGFWWAIVSASTVGYGDSAPRSVVGRLWGVVWILVGINVMSFLFSLMTSLITAELSVSSSIRGVQTAVVNGSEEHLAALLEGADVTDTSKGMEVATILPHVTLHGLLLSNTTADHVNCALGIVQKQRIHIVTAMHFQLNALEKEIGQAAYNASSKLLGPYDTTLCILLGVLVGLISILKICETIYHCAVQKKGLQDTDNSASQVNNIERYAPRLSLDRTIKETTITTEKL